MILKRPRDRQHGDITADPPATAQLQHVIAWKPYGLVPLFGYRSHHSPRIEICILLYDCGRVYFKTTCWSRQPQKYGMFVFCCSYCGTGNYVRVRVPTADTAKTS